jgi:hypothetical protein
VPVFAAATAAARQPGRESESDSQDMVHSARDEVGMKQGERKLVFMLILFVASELAWLPGESACYSSMKGRKFWGYHDQTN